MRVVPLPPAGLLVTTYGSGHNLEEERDDAVVVVGGLPGSPSLLRRKALNAAGCCDFLGHTTLLGNGRAVFQNFQPWGNWKERAHHLLVVRGLEGGVRRVEYDRVAGRLAIEGRGKGTGAETTRADNLVLSLESLALYAAESLDGARLRSEIVYPRP